MTSEMNDHANEHRLVSGLREAIDRNTVALVLMGIVASYSVMLLNTDVVSLPGIGSVLGLLVGAFGLTATAIAYRKIGCCGNCGSRKLGLSISCGCAGDCEDHCSYDP